MEQIVNINILGTRYIVVADSSKVEKGNDGQCENYNKAIYVKDKDDILDEYRDDELLVQWLAKQFPKMINVMREVGSI